MAVLIAPTVDQAAIAAADQLNTIPLHLAALLAACAGRDLPASPN